MTLPLADHGNVVSALPFVVPMVLIVAGLAFLMIRDRLERNGSTERDGRGGGAA